jgi:hypothetical protein
VGPLLAAAVIHHRIQDSDTRAAAQSSGSGSIHRRRQSPLASTGSGRTPATAQAQAQAQQQAHSIAATNWATLAPAQAHPRILAPARGEVRIN